MEELEGRPTQPPSPFLVEMPGGATCPTPAWFVRWVQLGAFAAMGTLLSHARPRTVLAISAPARSMAAAAIAFGYCRQRFLAAPGTRCPDGLARSLSDLEPGQPAWFRLGDRVLSGTFYGILRGDQVRTGAGTYQAEKVREVRVPPHWARLPDGCRLLSTEDPAGRPFIDGILRGHSSDDFLTSWNQDLIIVGSPALVLADLGERVAPATRTPAVGALASVVRPLEVSSGKTGGQPVGWRSILMSSHSTDAVWSSWSEAPSVTILDGSHAVSRWLEECNAQLVIAILDRTEAGLDAAVSAIEQERAFMKPVAAGDLRWQLPRGCELLAFGSGV